MSFYGDLAATALAVLAQFGGQGVLNKRTASAYDSSSGKVTQATSRYAVSVVLGKDKEFTQGSAVTKTLSELIIGVTPGNPPIDNGDTIEFGGLTYKVVDPGQVAPDGVTTVVYVATVEV